MVDGLIEGCEDGVWVGEMKLVSVTQSAGFKQNLVPLHAPLQQLALTNQEKLGKDVKFQFITRFVG